MPSGAVYLFVSSGESVVLFTVSPYMLWWIERSIFMLWVYFFLSKRGFFLVIEKYLFVDYLHLWLF